ncbi:MAG: hypothetical protein AAGF15_04015 [Pseudomonadota bacterium]
METQRTSDAAAPGFTQSEAFSQNFLVWCLRTWVLHDASRDLAEKNRHLETLEAGFAAHGHPQLFEPFMTFMVLLNGARETPWMSNGEIQRDLAEVDTPPAMTKDEAVVLCALARLQHGEPAASALGPISEPASRPGVLAWTAETFAATLLAAGLRLPATPPDVLDTPTKRPECLDGTPADRLN